MIRQDVGNGRSIQILEALTGDLGPRVQGEALRLAALKNNPRAVQLLLGSDEERKAKSEAEAATKHAESVEARLEAKRGEGAMLRAALLPQVLGALAYAERLLVVERERLAATKAKEAAIELEVTELQRALPDAQLAAKELTAAARALRNERFELEKQAQRQLEEARRAEETARETAWQKGAGARAKSAAAFDAERAAEANKHQSWLDGLRAKGRELLDRRSEIPRAPSASGARAPAAGDAEEKPPPTVAAVAVDSPDAAARTDNGRS